MVQPTGTTSQDDTGPIEQPRAPQPPAQRRSRGSLRRWRARLIVLVLIAAAVLLFVRVSAQRSTDAARIDLGTLTLTAQSIPVEIAQTGLVTAVSVSAQQRVSAGQRLGTVQVTSTDADGDPKVTSVAVRAPRPGIVVDLPATVGSTLQPGLPFLELYDPAQVTFESRVALEDLPYIAPTMRATLRAEGITRTVRATVQRVVPRVGDDPLQPGESGRSMTVVLVPATADQVRGLVPGLRFTGYVDTRSGVPGTAPLVS